MVNAKEISGFLNEELKVKNFEDYANNGLQVENTEEIKKIGFSVDASLETFEKAKEAGCQMLITHHGMMYKGLTHINGHHYERVKFLIENNIAVYCAHLPLDAHPIHGNNIQIVNILKLKKIKPFGEHHNQTIGYQGEFSGTLEDVKKALEENGMKTRSLDFGKKEIKTVAIISGGAAENTFEAIQKGVDLYITGESSQYLHHLAKENKINVIFGGHYETEVFGVKALMPLLKEKFNVEVEFIDVPTLV